MEDEERKECEEISYLNQELRKRLNESEGKIKLLFNNTLVGIAVINADGIIQDVNKASESFTGYVRDEIIGKYYGDLVYKEDAPQHQELHDALLRNEINSFILEQRYVKKNKEVIWGRLGVSAARGEEGNMINAICICEDITARKMAETALIESKLELDSIIKFIPDVVFRMNENGTILFISGSIRRYGYDDKELCGNSMFELICHKYREKFKELSGTVFFDNEFCLLTKDNDCIPVLISMDVIENHTGKSLRLIQGIAKDITDFVRRREESEKLIWKLETALHQVKVLSGYLRICASCKRIKDDEGNWKAIEEYIGGRAEVEFTHGICPDCAKRLYPDLKITE